MADTHRIPVHVRGTLRGSAVDADASVRLLEDVVSIQLEEREYTTRVDRVDGVVWESPTLTLYIGGDEAELTGHPGLQQFGAQITQSV